MNMADSSTLATSLDAQGYQQVEDISQAELIVVNTCSVRQKAETRALGRIHDLRRYQRANPSVRVAVVGCMAQRLGDELLAKTPGVDFVLGTDRLFDLPDLLSQGNGSATVATLMGRDDLDLITPAMQTSYSGFVTISRGCNNYCSYCIVPSVRGPERAHSANQIIQSIKDMTAKGAVEITLLGQNVNSYRSDDLDFPGLLERVITETDLPRIRYMTSHPKDLSQDLIDIMSREPRLMPHVHLPLQSGSDRILRDMGRKYTVERYLDIVRRLRDSLEYVSLTTDLIVGYPTESEDEYEQTLAVVREVGYDAAFMFRYSPRVGTKSAGLPDDVPEPDKIRRLEALIELQKAIGQKRNQREVGQVRHALVEGTSRRSESLLRGRTEGNKTVLFESAPESVGLVLPIKITSADAFTLHGERVEVNG